MNDGGPAFPLDPLVACHENPAGHATGMTLRDYFAARALGAMIECQYFVNDCTRKLRDLNPAATKEDVCEEIARLSYMYADAMLAERAKPVPA